MKEMVLNANCCSLTPGRSRPSFSISCTMVFFSSSCSMRFSSTTSRNFTFRTCISSCTQQDKQGSRPYHCLQPQLMKPSLWNCFSKLETVKMSVCVIPYRTYFQSLVVELSQTGSAAEAQFPQLWGCLLLVPQGSSHSWCWQGWRGRWDCTSRLEHHPLVTTKKVVQLASEQDVSLYCFSLAIRI